MTTLFVAAQRAQDTFAHIIHLRHLSFVGQAMAESAARELGAAIAETEESVAWREPLTDEQIAQCIVEARVNGPFARAGTTSFRIARAVERAHGIGGSNE